MLDTTGRSSCLPVVRRRSDHRVGGLSIARQRQKKALAGTLSLIEGINLTHRVVYSRKLHELAYAGKMPFPLVRRRELILVASAQGHPVHFANIFAHETIA